MIENDIITAEEDKEEIFCKRCGRKLKGNHSKILGFGPNCYRRWKKERSQQIPLFESEGDKNE